MQTAEISSNDRYILWINRILMEARKSYQVKMLTDENICNGKALFDILEYLSKDTISGYVNVKSKRAVLYNLQILLNRVASLKIRMSLIQPIDIERGDVPSILRFVLGLIRHYQPHLVRPKNMTATKIEETRSTTLLNRAWTPQHSSVYTNDGTVRINRIGIARSPIKSKLQKIISAQRPNSEMSNIIVTESRARCLSDSSTLVCESLPRDIQDIRNQLTELKQLLSRPDIGNEPYEKREKSCQTYLIESSSEQNIRQRDSLIARQQDQLNNLRIKLECNTRSAEAASKELSILKTQQSRRNAEIDPKSLEQFITLLKSIRTKYKLDNADLEPFDDGVNLIASLAVSMKTQVDKSNIAIINPCSKKVTGKLKDSPRNLVLPQKSEFSEESFSQFHADSTNPFEKGETKMVYFLGKSPTPNFLVIPLPPKQITLATVKEYTAFLLPKDITMKYFFKISNPNVGQSREQLIRDQDPVPVIDGRIVVFIQP